MNLTPKVYSLFGNNKHNFYTAIFLWIVLVLMLPLSAHSDLGGFKAWALHVFENGISNIYENSPTDYLPVTHYIMYFFMHLQQDLHKLDTSFYTFKLIFYFIDFVFAIFLLWWLKIEKNWLAYFIFLVLNPAFFYNSYIWGQVDSLYSVVVVFSLFMAYKSKIEWAWALMFLAVLCKLQAIFYIPILGILSLPHFFQKPIRVVYSILSAASVCAAFILPLANPMKVWDVAFQSVDHYAVVSANAYNMWFLMIPKDILLGWKLNDSMPFIGITYKYFGYIIFLSLSFLALFPLLLYSLGNIRQKRFDFPPMLITLSGALVALLFFYTLSQMHERYCHTTIYFLAILAFYYRSFWMYFIFSYAYVANLDRVYNFFKMPNYEIVPLQPVFISVLFLIVLILLFYNLYKKFYSKSFAHFNTPSIT